MQNSPSLNSSASLLTTGSAAQQAMGNAGDITVSMGLLEMEATRAKPPTPVTMSQLEALSDAGALLQSITIHDLGLEGHELRDCVLVNVSLKDCIIIRCTLNGCLITSSAEEDAHHLSRPGLRSQVWRSGLESCTIQSSHVYHSQTRLSIITKTRVEVGQVHDSKSSHSTLSNTAVEGSALVDCHLYNSDSVNQTTVTNSTTTTSLLALRRFPTEIRRRIFEAVFQHECQASDSRKIRLKRITLINALRGGDPIIYHDALTSMFSTCAFLLLPIRYPGSSDISLLPKKRVWNLETM